MPAASRRASNSATEGGNGGRRGTGRGREGAEARGEGTERKERKERRTGGRSVGLGKCVACLLFACCLFVFWLLRIVVGGLFFVCCGGDCVSRGSKF